MSKYVIVSIVEANFPKEFQYIDWPLHTTLLRPFTTDIPSKELTKRLENICAQHQIIVTKGKSKEMFGPESDVPVTELVNTPELQNLHKAIKSTYVDEIEFTAPQYSDFRPHVTENKKKGIEVGELVQIHSISLVELTPNNHKILAIFPLN